MKTPSPPTVALLAAAGVSAGVYFTLERYRPTSTKLSNRWTAEALKNVLATRRWFDHARDEIGGKFTSVYRSPAVNAAVGGSATSRHVRGLACDIVPGKPWDIETAARHLWSLHKAKALGPVHQIIVEADCVHVSFWAPGEKPTKVTQFLREHPGGKYSAIA